MRTWRFILRRPTGAVSLTVLAIVAVLTATGPLIAPYDPLAQHPSHILEGPSAQFLLGTDYAGRDVLSRLLAGSTLSVLSAIEAVAIALVLGVAPAIASVYGGRSAEWVSLRLMDSFMALPFITFAIAMAALLGNGLHPAMLAVGILVSPTFFRVTRAALLGYNNLQYVEAARLFGHSTLRTVWVHVWPKVVPTVLVTAAASLAGSLLVVASLTFLGIGVQPPDPTWGGMLASDLAYLTQKPLGPLAPALAIVVTVAALGLIADLVRDATSDSPQRRRRTRRSAPLAEAAVRARRRRTSNART